MSVYKRYANIPGQILYRDGATASPEDYEQFRRELCRFSSVSRDFWRTMLDEEPIRRLCSNLQQLSELLRANTFTTVIPDGVGVYELNMLKGLSRLSSVSQVVGHELLNLRERQHYVDKFRIVFNAYRCKGVTKHG